MTPASHRLVFVGGLHRSGTSPFDRLLAGHPLISGLTGTGQHVEEGQHVQDVYPPAVAFGGPGRFGFHPGAHLTEESDLVSEASAARLLAAWSPYWDLERPILVEKSPPNLIRMRFLQALFPHSAFIVVVRHPVVVSLATKRWARWQSVRSLLAHWVHCHRIVLADAPAVERLLVVKFEELCADPEAVAARVARFLNVPDHFDVSPVDPSTKDKYAQWWERLSTRFPTSLYGRHLRSRFAGPVRHFGYDLDDLDWCEPLPIGSS